MKFAVGYPVFYDEDQPFVEMIEPYRGHVEEIYFAWPGEPSGRSAMGVQDGAIDWSVRERLEQDLVTIREMGIKLDLLLNANCYGKLAMSRKLAGTITAMVEHLREVAGLEAVTTTSPFIARVLKDRFSDLEVRASVNMRVGSIAGMEYLADDFDGFYMQRDFNRDFAVIRELKAWCGEREKRLFMLANSGCLKFCSGQTFHDNLVAHEMEVAETINLQAPVLTCQKYLKEPEHRRAILQATWVRPEDLKGYEEFFPFVKLATRQHHNPARVLQAYVQGRYSGNLLDLLEPGHREAFQGCVIDNSRFPAEWFTRVCECSKNCHQCNYCGEVLQQVMVGEKN